MATAIAVRNNHERELVKMGERNGAARALKRGYNQGLDEGKRLARKAKSNAIAAATEDRLVAGVATVGGGIAGAALQAKLIDPNITNVWAKRLIVPGIGGVGGLTALAMLDGTAASGVGGALIGTALGSGIYQLADWLAS